MMKQLITTLLLLFFHLTMLGQAQTRRQFSIELDPAPFILNGYSISLKYSPKKWPKTAFMASLYQADFPNGMLTGTNKNKGWRDLKIKTSYAFFADFYLNEQKKGFHFGPSLFWYNKNVRLEQAQTTATFRTLYPNLRTGYVWYPFQKLNFYLNPWLNIGSEICIDNKNKLEGVKYKPNSFNYIVALHLGYSFR